MATSTSSAKPGDSGSDLNHTLHVSWCIMCQRHGPQESPGTEVLKKRFLFADCYVCQTACCLLQCSAKGSIAMLARCGPCISMAFSPQLDHTAYVLYGHCPKQDLLLYDFMI